MFLWLTGWPGLFGLNWHRYIYSWVDVYISLKTNRLKQLRFLWEVLFDIVLSTEGLNFILNLPGSMPYMLSWSHGHALGLDQRYRSRTALKLKLRIFKKLCWRLCNIVFLLPFNVDDSYLILTLVVLKPMALSSPGPRIMPLGVAKCKFLELC